MLFRFDHNALYARISAMGPFRQIGRPLYNAVVFCLFLAFSGCLTLPGRIPKLPRNAIKPVMAVMEFDNEAGFSGEWKLGRDLSAILTAELLKTGRFTLVERRNLPTVVDEIKRQGRDLFRKEGSVEQGRLANARYLVRGVISEFSHEGNITGWFRTPRVSIGGQGSKAVVILQLSVTDVETGEIISCVSAGGSVSASAKWIRFDYQKAGIGTEVFSRTPLGRATESAIRKCVVKIAKDVPLAYWQPRIAEADSETVIINGGRNFRIKSGTIYQVHEAGRHVTDPETGNVIDNLSGKIIGQIRVTDVLATSARGIVLSGMAKRGCALEEIEE